MITFEHLFNVDPEAEYFPEYDCNGEFNGVSFDGIKALTYRGADYEGKPTRVFAHIGFPEKTDRSIPAVILIHGGGGHPDDAWIKKWNSEGYAAIAMDTTGFFPTKPICLCEGLGDGDMIHGLHSPFYRQGHTVLPENRHMSDSYRNICDQWMYQAVASVVIANNLLRADNRIDPDRIGICGISWGGIVTSVAIGFDLRFAFAIPIYGSGYLGSGLSGLARIFKAPGVQKWYPEKRFCKVNIPVMWLCWNDDCCFSLNSNSMSYEESREGNPNTCLSMLHNMGHSHSCAYTPKESYWFADRVLSGKDIPRIEARYIGRTVKYSCSERVNRVRLFYITEEMNYTRREKYGLNNTFMEQEWQIAELPKDKNQAVLPENAVGKYIEFTLEGGIVLTTPYHEFKNPVE